jgi:hypothetical protein
VFFDAAPPAELAGEFAAVSKRKLAPVTVPTPEQKVSFGLDMK